MAMAFFARLSPIRAITDLRSYLAGRPSYEIGFLALAIVITGVFLYLFSRDDIPPPAYQPDIVYVQQWPLSRTDAEIRAAQVVDQKVKTQRLAAEKAEQEKRKAEFRKLDNALTKWGF